MNCIKVTDAFGNVENWDLKICLRSIFQSEECLHNCARNFSWNFFLDLRPLFLNFSLQKTSSSNQNHCGRINAVIFWQHVAFHERLGIQRSAFVASICAENMKKPWENPFSCRKQNLKQPSMLLPKRVSFTAWCNLCNTFIQCSYWLNM